MAEQRISIIRLFLMAFGALVFIGFMGYFITQLTGFLPFNSFGLGSESNTANYVYTATFSSLDLAIVAVVVIGIVIDMVVSYRSPSREKALINALMVIALGITYSFLGFFITQLSAIIPFNTILPDTSSAWNSGALVFIAFFGLIVSAVLNMRHNDTGGPNDYLNSQVDYAQENARSGYP
jgi:hypothetical protein